MSQKAILQVEDEDKETIKKILEDFDYNKSNLISILQNVQEQYGFLPRNIIFHISSELNVPPAEIYGVATFYTQFKFTEIGKNLIVCCDGTACHVKGSIEIIHYIEGILGIKPGETTEDKMFSLESVACLGCCAISPVCVINGEIHGNLTTNKVKRIINKIQKAS